MEFQQDTYWQDVVERNRQADGRFVYGVATTRVYCRPSCPSKKPRRENVSFFPLPAAAEEAGYRPCKRCQPRQVAMADPRLRLVQQVCDYIQAHADEPAQLTLSAIGAHVHYDARHVQEIFKDVLGITPHQYAEAHRIRHLKAHLRASPTVAAAVYEAGFGSASRVYERADAAMGMTPGTYHQQGEGMAIACTVADCYLGSLLVAMTERGICAVGIYDDAAQALAALHAEYPRADIRRDDASLKPLVVGILEHVDGRRPVLDLPLDIQATAFQWRVWQELRRIPRGETRSYSDIAYAIGQPSATRAVANACAHNVAAIVIPCHRVVGKGGRLSGYRWGAPRKRMLLAREADGNDAATA